MEFWSDKQMSRILFLLLAFVLPTSVGAENQTLMTKPAASFEHALQLSKEENHLLAYEEWSAFLKIDPTNLGAIYNIGKVSYDLQKYALAAAYFRRALSLNPRFTEARFALQQCEKNLQLAPSSETPMTIFEAWVIRPLPLILLGVLFLLCVTYGIWGLLSWWGERRSFDEEERETQPLPPGKTWGALLFGLLFGGLFVCKIYLSTLREGTVIKKSLDALSSPDPQGTPLFELPYGGVVSLGERHGDWVQVKNSSGMVGWVEKSHVYKTAGPDW